MNGTKVRATIVLGKDMLSFYPNIIVMRNVLKCFGNLFGFFRFVRVVGNCSFDDIKSVCTASVVAGTGTGWSRMDATRTKHDILSK